jgi:hypothetical protein
MALSTEQTPDLTIPWGEAGRLPLDWPGTWRAPTVFRPDLAGAVDDYGAALNGVLDDPAGVPALGTGLGAGSKVAIVVDDPSRWTPVREALPHVLGRLRGAGVRPDDVSISVGVGRHHAVDDSAMRQRVGDAVVAAYRCYSPPVDDRAQYAELGVTPEGVPVRVFRPVAEADLRILIGSVLPHLQAGFGGGYKLIFPGTSHRTTLGGLHRQGLAHADRLIGGDRAHNPMRRAIGAAADRLGPCFSISHLVGAPAQVLHVAAGHPDPVQDALAAEARRRFCAPDGAETDLVAAGNHPWPGDPMQSFKVLLHHRAACRRGGVLAGFFWTAKGEVDRSFPLWGLRAIAATGALGGWTARRGLAALERAAAAAGAPSHFMLRWARELVVDRTVLVYAPPLRARLGPRLGPVRLFSEPGDVWRAAAEALGRTPASARVFPYGGLTYAAAHPAD